MPDRLFSLHVNGKEIFPSEQFRSMTEYSDALQANNFTVFCKARLCGGGPKRGRSTGTSKTEEAGPEPIFFEKPVVERDDCPSVVASLNLNAVFIEPFLVSLSVTDLKSLMDKLDGTPCSGNTTQIG